MPTDQPFDRDQLDIEAHVRRMVEEIERGEEDDGVRAAEMPAPGEPAGPRSLCLARQRSRHGPRQRACHGPWLSPTVSARGPSACGWRRR